MTQPTRPDIDAIRAIAKAVDENQCSIVDVVDYAVQSSGYIPALCDYIDWLEAELAEKEAGE